MKQFRYHVSLRITHPDIDPDEMTQGLGLIPKSVRRKGDALKYDWLKKLPDDVVTAYAGKHSWFHMFEPGSPDEPLACCMRSAIARVRERRDFIERAHNTGGRVEFTVHLYPPGGRDQPFDYSLITELRELGIGVQITIHPREDYMHDPTDIVATPDPADAKKGRGK